MFDKLSDNFILEAVAVTAEMENKNKGSFPVTNLLFLEGLEIPKYTLGSGRGFQIKIQDGILFWEKTPHFSVHYDGNFVYVYPYGTIYTKQGIFASPIRNRIEALKVSPQLDRPNNMGYCSLSGEEDFSYTGNFHALFLNEAGKTKWAAYSADGLNTLLENVSSSTYHLYMAWFTGNTFKTKEILCVLEGDVFFQNFAKNMILWMNDTSLRGDILTKWAKDFHPTNFFDTYQKRNEENYVFVKQCVQNILDENKEEIFRYARCHPTMPTATLRVYAEECLGYSRNKTLYEAEDIFGDMGIDWNMPAELIPAAWQKLHQLVAFSEHPQTLWAWAE